MFSIIQGVYGLIGRNGIALELYPVLKAAMICDPMIRRILRTRPMEMEITTDLDEKTTDVVTVHDEFVPLTAVTLDAITAIVRGTKAQARKRYGTAKGTLYMPQRAGSAVLAAAAWPQRRTDAIAQIETAAAHLRSIGRKRQAKALLKQGLETWAEIDF